MKKVLFCLSFILIQTILLGQNARLHIKAAQQYLTNGYYEEALEQYNKALEFDPTNGHIYEERARVYELLKDLQHASDDFQSAAVFQTNPPDNFYNSAKILFDLKKYNEAKIAINKAIALKPKFYEAFILRCRILLFLDETRSALESAQNALLLRNTACAYYLIGISNLRLDDLIQAEENLEKAIIKDKLYLDAYLELARLQLILENYDPAITNCSFLILNDSRNISAYELRSKAYAQQKEFDKAIADISYALTIDSTQVQLYLLRGNYHYQCTQYLEAIKDYSLVLTLDIVNEEALTQRASSYEITGNNKEAVSDYALFLKLVDPSDKKTLDRIEKKIYELQRENNKPNILIQIPKITDNQEIAVPTDNKYLTIYGSIFDESKILWIKLNNDTLIKSISGTVDPEFSTNINCENLEYITISSADIYENINTVAYSVRHIETQAPIVQLLNPVLSQNNAIQLIAEENFLYIEGQIEDESKISSILINETKVSYSTSDINPKFTATIDVTNKDRFVIIVQDIFGNKTEQQYSIQRKGIEIDTENPMGKTWVVLIENSAYSGFTNLYSTADDIKYLREAFSQYNIDNIILKKNLTKREMERFFSIDLRDLIRANHVSSLIIWYAGHGKFINSTGYWIPCDAQTGVEFSYYSINALKACLYSYTSLTHLLIVSDACKTGPGFSIAMRGEEEDITCNQIQLALKKSVQVFSSAGSSNAYDSSLFARSFSNALLNAENHCISIDDIVQKVNSIMQENSVQQPEFGRIRGLEDDNGTFFFFSQ